MTDLDNAVLRALKASGIRVKPLVWKRISDKFGERIDAQAQNIGEYSLRGHARGYVIIWLNERPLHPVQHGAHFTYGDDEAAKAAAQADYEARILAALDVEPGALKARA